MDQERIEAELERSAELERQRMERERAEKARVAERGTVLDANAAVGCQLTSTMRSWCSARGSGKKAGAEPSGVA